MKRLGLTLGLCLVAAVSFGQKKAVADALRLAKDATNPNFTEARTKIKGALENAETKDDAKTWYTAGQIESIEFDKESAKQMIGQEPNYEAMYTALEQIYPYFAKTYELDLLPDAKGKVKPKFAKDMKAILKADMPYYMNAAAYYFEKQDFKKAFNFFDQYVVISDCALMAEESKKNDEAVVDSNYIYANYYAAIAAMQTENPTLAISAIKRASMSDYKRNDLIQYLSEEYKNLKDTVNWEKTLVEGLEQFPKEEYFLINLIGIYLGSDRNKKALDYIQAAIQNEPNNAQYYDIAGRIYEASKESEKAEESYKKSIELDGENSEVLFNIGRFYFNSGVAYLEEIDSISDVKTYNAEREKVNELFRKAMPLLEKSLQINPDPDTNDCRIALRSIYYHLNMEDKSAEMDKQINGM